MGLKWDAQQTPRQAMTEKGWVEVGSAFKERHYCPECWHKIKLAELSQLCHALVLLVQEHFRPPNGMAWGDPESGWKVTIENRRGGDPSWQGAGHPSES